ncbi:excitatory amino acid transporter-like isoform X2 [Littorina saxatilis]|uniref:Amino acid transporter n=2 Tax=Littorina saxatilis TaxID=31220 RepID=A0AAN9ANF7_9CAEN
MDTQTKASELEGLTNNGGTELTNGVTMNHDVVVEPFDPRQSLMPKLRLFLAANIMLILTCVGIVLGFAIGFGVRELHPSKDALMWIGMPGELFLRMLKMMILPLVVCSVITGTASLDPKANGKISAVTFAYVIITHIIACVIAIVLCLLIKPGEGKSSVGSSLVDQEPMETQDIFADLLRNMIPDNMVEATFRKAHTRYRMIEETVSNNSINGTSTFDTLVTATKYASKTDGLNVLGLIGVSTVIGIAINKVKDKASIFLGFFSGATDVVLVIIRWLFCLTPVGVASLIAVSIAGVADLSTTFSQLGKFLLTVCVGILLHQFIVLPVILFVTTRRNPLAFLLSIVRPYMIGFASTSSAVAIPEMLDACERRNKIDSRVCRFVIPLCTTINADGSAIYITSAAIFIAHFTGRDVMASDIIIIGVLTAVAAMAVPSVPSASIVTLVIILTSLNIPANDIALMFAVEWILDRLRTACNVVSHTTCAAVTYHFCKKNLGPCDVMETPSDVERNILTKI